MVNTLMVSVVLDGNSIYNPCSGGEWLLLRKIRRKIGPMGRFLVPLGLCSPLGKTAYNSRRDQSLIWLSPVFIMMPLEWVAESAG